MATIKLSPRLAAVADLVTPGHKLADIGSDHAYLPAVLLMEGRIPAALVGEVSQGPLDNARHTVGTAGLNEKVTCRLADGLAAIEPTDGIQTVVIAGMGGLLIEKILAAGTSDQPFDQLILQPNTDQEAVRRWLVANGYAITTEKIVAEGHHRYEIIVAQPGIQDLTPTQLAFGPVLLAERDPVFVTKWELEKGRLETLLDRLKSNGQGETDKYQNLAKEYQKIKEAVFHD
ncbi:tRNA (adenine(22)-N(1))-methyltransferase [Fructobacillus ficulneus]|uniref:Predicted SAM-dependent methyltransferase n=1 Tax=Fructobacillus ficulneus TaxID=157463 RepID=A0A0K8MIM7_9LACO|nr:class I SAM-dependent methyltransferase [Fructobacillus ficulneus]GAP00411.1 predicted SAM-dependent methyltransferase [Fructobacillus ficulneus]